MPPTNKLPIDKPVTDKPLFWVREAISKEIRGFPEDVRREIGAALRLAQRGTKAIHAHPMVGFGGASVVEIVVSHDGEAYRAVYTIRFAEAVYVLHVFQKKSKRGIKTPQHELEVIKSRLKDAQEHYEQNFIRNQKGKVNER